MEVFHGTCSYGVLSAIRHKWTHPTLTPAMQTGTRFTYPGGMEGWVDLVDLIAPQPGVEPATFRSRVRRSTTAQPRQTVEDSQSRLYWLVGPGTAACPEILGRAIWDKWRTVVWLRSDCCSFTSNTDTYHISHHIILSGFAKAPLPHP